MSKGPIVLSRFIAFWPVTSLMVPRKTSNTLYGQISYANDLKFLFAFTTLGERIDFRIVGKNILGENVGVGFVKPMEGAAWSYLP